MIMDKAFAALAMLAFFIALAAPAHAEVYGSSLNVVLTNQTPYPVEPGSNVDIGIQLQNNGRDNAQGAYLEIVPGNPFELLPGQDAIKFFSQVPSLDSVKTSYKLRVNNSAITNNYNLDFRIYLGSPESSYFTKSISVNIQGIPDLIIKELSTAP